MTRDVATTALGAIVVLFAMREGTLAAIGVSAVIVVLLVLRFMSAKTSALLLIFLLVAFPKAGAKVGGTPIPVLLLMYPVIILCVARYIYGDVRRGGHLRPATIFYALSAGAFAVVRFIVYERNGVVLDLYLSTFPWFILLLVAGTYLARVASSTQHHLAAVRQLLVSIELGALAASAFTLLQVARGVTAFIIPGLTLALGDSYADKPLLFQGGTKYPGTYQNGNLLGPAMASVVLLILLRVAVNGFRPFDAVKVASISAAVLFSGSRTAVIGLLLGLGLLLVRRNSFRAKLAVTLIGAVLLPWVFSNPNIAHRLALSSLFNSAGTGRTGEWSTWIHTVSTSNFLFGSHWWDVEGQLLEGVPGAIQQFGAIPIALVALCLLNAVRQRSDASTIAILWAPFLVSFCLDSAFTVFPTLFIPCIYLLLPPDLNAAMNRKTSGITTSGRVLRTSASDSN